ncbi:hypothetical protein RirG_199750 [Rhizophagus irregularis DAOM 197198w]|uniref:Uncharacterized protein n=1 Tax=Rhizophagus irregularis (strain DAOM 197198w) TaxID=1432141 RepID=A0A015IM21_RHIIW|nr:hypothetical protein RirG_199750 [Rhizophagus irregularis DAOM 197198w]
MFARIVIAQYNITNPEEKYKLKHVERILLQSIRIQGFTVLQYKGTDIERDCEKDLAE